MRTGRLTCLLAAGGLAALTAGIVPAIPSGATTVPAAPDAAVAASPARLSADAVPPIPARSVRVGALAGQTVMHLDVTLKVRDPGALSEFMAALSSRNSPMFQHYLRRGQFAQRFGPTPAEVAKVTSALRAAGLSPGRVASDRLIIPVTASAAAVESAFGVHLIQYRLADGRLAYANSAAPRIPAAIRPYVQGVVGLDDLYLQGTDLVHLTRPAASRTRRLPRRMTAAPAASGPKPCSAATAQATLYGSYTSDELAAYYGMTSMYKLGDLGQGVHIAFVEFEPNLTTDISTYESCYGIKTKVTYHKVDDGAGSGAGSGEAALDIEDAISLAPDASIDVYQAPNGDNLDIFNAIISADTDQVISTSWGLCELDDDPSLMSSEQELIAMATSQGQTILASAGDTGSTDCLGDGTSNDGSLSVDDPASQPGVVGVGGTEITATGEKVWNESAANPPEDAGGGGLSVIWCMPSYQYKTKIPGLISADSQTNSGCSSSHDADHVRQVPDVAADADPFSGYVIYYDGSWRGGWGGTSAAAPLWAAVAALIDASPFCKDYGSVRAGAQPAGLYDVASAEHSYIYPSPATQPEVLYDVTSGNNDYTPSGYTGGLYPATRGYDMASGLGTPLLGGYASNGTPDIFYPGLTALMCHVYRTKLGTTSVTHLSPDAGAASRTRKVTVTGKGFLPIAGTDLAQVKSTSGKVLRDVAASCPSTTRCTVTLPALSARTVDIQMVTEAGLTISKVTAASRYTYQRPPTVTSLSPARGKAGTRIIIHGTNFRHVTAIHFGKKRATKFKVDSATQISVTVPSGSGTVSVTVTTAGGTSKVTRASHYRY